MTTARVQSRGQVTVPQDIRDACHIQPGSDLHFVQTGPNKFECQVLPPARALLDILDQFTVDGIAPDFTELRERMGVEMAHERMQDCAPDWVK